MIFPEELKIEAAEAYRQNILVPGFEHVNRNDWIDAWCCGVTYQLKKQQEEGWHDLRKDPKDLPKGHKVVYNQVGEKTTYDPERGFLGFPGAGIIAWREIVVFKKKLNHQEPPKEKSK